MDSNAAMHDYALWFILAFLAGLTGLGIYHARKIKSGEDFALAGRRLGPGVLIGTLVATWIGTGSIFGSTEKAYEIGLLALFLPIAGALGLVALSFLAPKVRELPADSVPEILKIRFGRGAQVLGALALIGAYLIIVSYQYRAGAAVGLNLFPELSQKALIGGEDPVTVGDFMPVFFAVFVVLYTVLAGMVSVAWTDLINGMLMAIGLLVALGLLLAAFKSDMKPIEEIAAIQANAKPISPIGWLGIMLPPFLLVLGDANLHQRFMSAGSPRIARRSAIGMFVGVVILEWAIIGIALLSRCMLTEAPTNHAHAVVDTAFQLVHPVVGIVLAATIVAVIVTTADSYLLGSATSLATDFAGGLTTPMKQRLIVLVLGVVALGLAYTSDKFFDVAIYAYTLYGATLTPALLCALFLPRLQPGAVLGGMAAGLGMALLWKVLAELGWLPAVLGDVKPVLPALALNILAIAVLAKVLPPTAAPQRIA
ncbi:MAG: sodium:solute symporter [Phycisphaerales bacterium JB038]